MPMWTQPPTFFKWLTIRLRSFSSCSEFWRAICNRSQDSAVYRKVSFNIGRMRLDALCYSDDSRQLWVSRCSIRISNLEYFSIKMIDSVWVWLSNWLEFILQFGYIWICWKFNIRACTHRVQQSSQLLLWFQTHEEVQEDPQTSFGTNTAMKITFPKLENVLIVQI